MKWVFMECFRFWLMCSVFEFSSSEVMSFDIWYMMDLGRFCVLGIELGIVLGIVFWDFR